MSPVQFPPHHASSSVVSLHANESMEEEFSFELCHEYWGYCWYWGNGTE